MGEIPGPSPEEMWAEEPVPSPEDSGTELERVKQAEQRRWQEHAAYLEYKNKAGIGTEQRPLTKEQERKYVRFYDERHDFIEQLWNFIAEKGKRFDINPRNEDRLDALRYLSQQIVDAGSRQGYAAFDARRRQAEEIMAKFEG